MPRHGRRPQLTTGLGNFSAHDPGNWSFLLERAKAADAAGIDRLTVSDHVVFGESLAAYARPELGGREGGTQPTGPDGHWLEPLTLLSVVAGITSRVRLSTGILLAALRRPVVLSKTLSTIDVLSGGRVDLGVGVGWQRAEYEACGLRFERRGRLLDHTLAVLETMWGQAIARFADEELTFEGIHSMPKPLQAGGIPIWVSGTANPSVARRLVRFGSGWIPWGEAADDIVTGIAQMAEMVTAVGGSLTDKRVMGSLRRVFGRNGQVDYPATMAAVPAIAAAGVTDMSIHFDLPADPDVAFAQYSAAVSAFRDVAGDGA